MTRIQNTLGLGPKSEGMLASVGIKTVEELKAVGAIQAFMAVKRAGLPASLNLLWALEGALTGQPWKVVAKVHRTSLLLALEQAEKVS